MHPGREELLVRRCRHRDAGETPLEGARAVSGHQSSHGTAVLGDLDLFAGSDLIEESKDLGLRLRCGQFFGHMVILQVMLKCVGESPLWQIRLIRCCYDTHLMSKQRLQVLLDEPELEELREAARRQGVPLSEWVRRALREARRREPRGDLESKLRAVRRAVQYEGPTGDIEQMLAEIEKGYTEPLPE